MYFYTSSMCKIKKTTSTKNTFQAVFKLIFFYFSNNFKFLSCIHIRLSLSAINSPNSGCSSNISAFCFPLFCFCDYIPLVSSRLPVDPIFLQIFVYLASPSSEHNFKLFRILLRSLRCGSMHCTPLHTIVVTFSLSLVILPDTLYITIGCSPLLPASFCVSYEMGLFSYSGSVEGSTVSPCRNTTHTHTHYRALNQYPICLL